MPDDTEPTSSLYTIAPLKPGADIARQVLADLPHIATLALDPDIVSAIAGIRGQIAKINGDLDFWGFSAATVPIWSFDYLQTVAINLAQLAVSVERDVINFWDQAGPASLSRQQLETAASSAEAEVAAATLQVQAAAAQKQAYQDGVLLATQRAQDAQQADEYAAPVQPGHLLRRLGLAQFSGGDDGSLDELNQLADQLLSGQSVSGTRGARDRGGATSWPGPRPTGSTRSTACTGRRSRWAWPGRRPWPKSPRPAPGVAAAEATAWWPGSGPRAARRCWRAFDNQVFTR